MQDQVGELACQVSESGPHLLVIQFAVIFFYKLRISAKAKAAQKKCAVSRYQIQFDSHVVILKYLIDMHLPSDMISHGGVNHPTN